MIQKLIDDVLLERERSKGIGTVDHWRCSGLGTCMRGRFLYRLLPDFGIRPTPDARTLRVFEVGNQLESWLIEILKSHPDYDLVGTQVEVYNPALNLKGHMDVLLRNKKTGKLFAIECKSKHSKSFWYMDKKGEGAQIHHKYQLHSYMFMYGNERIEEGAIVYISKDDMAILEYPVYRDDQQLYDAWKTEIETLNDCWDRQIAPPQSEEGSWNERYCEYCKLGICQKLDDKQVKELFELKQAVKDGDTDKAQKIADTL